jgi:hypothetical protein
MGGQAANDGAATSRLHKLTHFPSEFIECNVGHVEHRRQRDLEVKNMKLPVPIKRDNIADQSVLRFVEDGRPLLSLRLRTVRYETPDSAYNPRKGAIRTNLWNDSAMTDLRQLPCREPLGVLQPRLHNSIVYICSLHKDERLGDR